MDVKCTFWTSSSFEKKMCVYKPFIPIIIVLNQTISSHHLSAITYPRHLLFTTPVYPAAMIFLTTLYPHQPWRKKSRPISFPWQIIVRKTAWIDALTGRKTTIKVENRISATSVFIYRACSFSYSCVDTHYHVE